MGLRTIGGLLVKVAGGGLTTDADCCCQVCCPIPPAELTFCLSGLADDGSLTHGACCAVLNDCWTIPLTATDPNDPDQLATWFFVFEDFCEGLNLEVTATLRYEAEDDSCVIEVCFEVPIDEVTFYIRICFEFVFFLGTDCATFDAEDMTLTFYGASAAFQCTEPTGCTISA